MGGKGSFLGILLGATMSALAQESPPPAAEPYPQTVPVTPTEEKEPEPANEPAEGVKFEDVVVTATKRKQAARAIAGSVGALSGADLEKANAQSMEDYLKQIPGVALNKGDVEMSAPAIRGIATETYFQANQLPTGIYIDDVAFNDPIKPISTPDVNPFDLERVEVLKGPQGTLFGSSSLAGAVRYITAKPELGMWDSRVMLTGSHVDQGASISDSHANPVGALMVNAPIGEHFALRGVGLYRDEGGYVDELSRGEADANKLRQKGGRVLALWQPLDALRITATYLAQNSTSADYAFSDNRDSWTRSNTPTPSPQDTKVRLGNLSAEYDFGFASLLSSTSYVGKSARRVLNVDRNFSLQDQPATHTYVDSDGQGTGVSEELRLTSSDSGSFKWLVGGYFSRYGMDYFQTLVPRDGLLGNVLGPLQALLEGLGLALPAEATLITLTYDFVQRDYAAFGEATLRFLDDFELTAGARFYRTELAADLREQGVLSAATTGSLDAHVVDATAEQGVSPRLSLAWKPGRDFMSYALVSRGYRPGGIQITQSGVPGVGNGGEPYKSDKLWNYELGLRSRWFRTVTADVTAFYLDWRDMQVFQYDQFTIASFIQNVGKAHSKGIEAGVGWRPMVPWLSGFSLSCATALIDARTDEVFNGANGMVPAGTPLPGTSHFQVVTSAGYVLPLGSVRLSASASHSYQGHAYNDLYKRVDIGEYGTIDARLAIAAANSAKTREISVWAHNLGNTPGVSSAFSGTFATAGFADYYLVAPRTVGVSLTVGL